MDELDRENQDRLLLRGGFPKSFLAKSDSLSFQWRQNYTRTFLEQDVPQLGIQIPAQTLRRFWQMHAHYFLGRSSVPFAFQVHAQGEKDWYSPTINGTKPRILPLSKFLAQFP